jgi:hypothetical protein
MRVSQRVTAVSNWIHGKKAKKTGQIAVLPNMDKRKTL